ncbi:MULTISPECIES: hypothetical protein [unclassified Streptomyces]|uniref:hypothetical protein n=1 Tax=unclassified Streptomyces TaxID=2593676 RepID=UPI0033AB62B2
MTLLSSFLAAGVVLLLAAVAGVWTHRLSQVTADGLSALAFALIGIGRVMDSPTSTAVEAATAAYFAYHWWNGRDGDGGAGRRLRDSIRRFTATRRTAPATG